MPKIKFNWNLIKNRSELGRELFMKRMLKLHSKSVLTAYSLWALLGGIGAHRIYLGQWRQAIFLFAFLMFVVVSPSMMNFVPYLSKINADITSILLIVISGVWLFEGVRLYSLVQRWNEKLREELEMHMVFV